MHKIEPVCIKIISERAQRGHQDKKNLFLISLTMEDSCVVGLSTSVSRKSPFQMISVKEGVDLVLTNTSVLDEIQIPFENCIGYVASRDIYCPYPFPIRPTSIMDGYAVSAPLVPGVYKIVESVFAGSMPSQSVECSEVSYITTGGILPPGSNAVVKIEDTEAYQHEGKCDNFVKILVSVKPGCNVREIGSDIQAGDMIIAKGKVLDHVDIGLLATIGVCFVYVFRKPKIGVLSTGNELVEPSETPLDGQIRDSNRISIISSLKASGYDIIDLGIMRDDMIPSEVDAYFLSLCSYIDIVISSGGVSMGKADFVKPSLARIGDIHFGRLLMKPGKPTTFATIRNDCGKRSMLFFALPGNPVSCLVSKILLVDTALKKMQGFEDERCRSQSMEAELYGRSHNLGIPMDPERPEYHRGIVEWSFEGPKWIVRSTDEMNQRSSRLLSAQEANALLVIPQGKGTLLYGSSVSILFLSHLPFNCTNFSSFTYSEAQRAKVVVEIPKVGQVTQDTSRNSKAHINETNGVDPVTMELYESFNNILHQNNKLKVTTRLSNESLRDWRNIRVALLTISDRVSWIFLNFSFNHYRYF